MRTIARCLNPKLAELCERVIQLDTINELLARFLPETIRAHCDAGSFAQGCLVLVVPDAVWASQLRYLLPQLRDQLRSEAGLYQLVSIKITVHSTPLEINRKVKTTRKLSKQARQNILEASYLCHYEPLKKALWRFAEVDSD